MRRRIRTECLWSGNSWITNQVVRYVYDGNLVIQERNGNNLPQVTYTRGNDLTGTLQGAGGIGGLLARTDNALFVAYGSSGHAYYHCDGNGNVTCLINSNQTIVARYLYDPYGNVLSQSGPLVDANLYRFSSKEFHTASRLIYYLYRFYDPNLQRWPNRDPLGELGFFQIHPELTVFQLENQILALSKKARDMHLFSPAELAQGPNLFVFVGNQPTLIYDFGGLLGCGNCYDIPALNIYCWVIGGLACGPVIVLPFGIVLYPICAYGVHNWCCFYEYHMIW
jgi:RHS repeat-associated protein